MRPAIVGIGAMARFEEKIVADMTGNQRRVADTVSAAFHGLAGPYVVWIDEPEIAERLFRVVDYLRNEAPLPHRLRLIATLMAVRYWRAAYAWNVNAQQAELNGVPTSAIAAMERGETPKFDDAKDRAAYEMCRELLETRALSDAGFAKAVAALGVAFVREIAITLGYFSTVALTVNAFNVLPPPDKMPAFARPGAARD
jgi:4-carboxymuconolactone decarboxylase